MHSNSRGGKLKFLPNTLIALFVTTLASAPVFADPAMEWVQEIVLAVRRIRGEMNIKPSARVPLLLRNAPSNSMDLLARHGQIVKSLAGVDSIEVLENGQAIAQAASAVVGRLRLR